MIVIVDGDNSPGANINGIEQLEETDKVAIYFASDNKYYTHPDRTTRINNTAKCTIEYAKVTAADCAVDIAIAMDLVNMIGDTSGDLIVLVSADKHFETIARQAGKIDRNIRIFISESIGDAVKDYKLLECRNLKDVRRSFQMKYGNEEGMRLYQGIYKMLTNEFKSKNQGNNEEKHSTQKTRSNSIRRMWDKITGCSKSA